MNKLTLLVAAGAGYVLGSRAGRERYEQIKQQTTKFWHNPTVQDTVDGVQTHARQAGADLGSKVAETASDVKGKVADKVSSSSDDDRPETMTPGQGTA